MGYDQLLSQGERLLQIVSPDHSEDEASSGEDGDWGQDFEF